MFKVQTQTGAISYCSSCLPTDNENLLERKLETRLIPFPVLSAYSLLAMQTSAVTQDTFTWVFTDTPPELILISLFRYLPVCMYNGRCSFMKRRCSSPIGAFRDRRRISVTSNSVKII